MRFLKKTTALLIIAIIAITAFATKSSAFSKEDLQEYMENKKDFTRTLLIIRDSDRVKLETFLKKTEMTDEQATKIRDYIDQAVAYMNVDDAKSPNKVSTTEKKHRLLQYAIDAAAVLNMSVKYDASEERLDIYDANGKFVDSLFWGVETGTQSGISGPALVQTGSTNYEYVAIAGFVLAAGITFIIARKKALSAND